MAGGVHRANFQPDRPSWAVRGFYQNLRSMNTGNQVAFRLFLAFFLQAILSGSVQADETVESADLESGLTQQQIAVINIKRQELSKQRARIELAKAKLDALKSQLKEREARIAQLNEELAKKQETLSSGDHGGGGDTAESQSKLPARFLVDANKHIVIIEGDRGSGTGFICMSGGEPWVYTAAHVLSGNSKISVRDYEGRVYRDFERLECAEGVDLLRLKLKDTDLKGFEVATKAEIPKAGDTIVAVGNSLGTGSLSGEPGEIISSGEDMWEVDAEIIPGNSGGPVLSLSSGKVVGIVTHLTIERRRKATASAGKATVKRFAARLDKQWEWHEMPITRFVSEWQYIDKMASESSVAWASILLMHTAPGLSGTPPMSKEVALARSIAAKRKNHFHVQRVDEWLKKYRNATSTFQKTELIEEGNQIIELNLNDIKLDKKAPKPKDFSWYHRQLFDDELEWRASLSLGVK